MAEPQRITQRIDSPCELFARSGSFSAAPTMRCGHFCGGHRVFFVLRDFESHLGRTVALATFRTIITIESEAAPEFRVTARSVIGKLLAAAACP